MPQILYTVRAACPSVQIRGRYLAWLVPNHLLAVQTAGAASARVILPDPAGGTAPAPILTAAPAVVEVH